MLNKPSAAKHPLLKKAWDEYGHAIAWDDLVACRFGAHGYVVLAWRENGLLNMADLAWDGEEWQMQNDGHDPVTDAQWAKLTIPRDCDWFVIPGTDYKGYA